MRKLAPVKFRTEIQIPPIPWKIDYGSRILSMGSCFAERIGQRLSDSRFRIQINPMGIVFNPLSLTKLLHFAASEDYSATEDLIFNQGRWHAFDFHSSLSDPEEEMAEAAIRSSIAFTHRYLADADVLMLTLGTAYAYRLKESGAVVNNCHKVPAARFEKVLLGVDECVNALLASIQVLRARNPRLKVLLTVSPVRHIKDGLAENNLSKSILRLVCHQVESALKEVTYFPSLEILQDDLRDYRFYQDDLIHPNSFAEQYIWEKFGEAAFDESTFQILNAWESAQKAFAHRPFDASGDGYRHHLEMLLPKLEELNFMLDCSSEIDAVKGKLRNIELGERNIDY